MFFKLIHVYSTKKSSEEVYSSKEVKSLGLLSNPQKTTTTTCPVFLPK